MPRPKATFEIRVKPGSHYRVRVQIYKTIKGFHAAEGVGYGKWGRSGKRLMACCFGIEERDRATNRLSGLFAGIRMPEAHMRMNTITHELFHATMRWAKRAKIDGRLGDNVPSGHLRKRRSAEEQCAIVHGNLCSEFVRQMNRLKIGG